MKAMSTAAFDFFQLDVDPARREPHGLHGLLGEAFPVWDPARRRELAYVSYEARPPRESVPEVIERGTTFAAELTLVLRLVLMNEEGRIRDVREQRVGFWEIPVPTPEGTYVVDGIELNLDAVAVRRATSDLVATLAATAEARLAEIAHDEDLTPGDLVLDDDDEEE